MDLEAMSHTRHDGTRDNCDACEVVRETVDLVKTALAAQCDCYFTSCVHDQVRWLAEHKYGLRDKLPDDTPWLVIKDEVECPVCVQTRPEGHPADYAGRFGYYCIGPGSIQISHLFDLPNTPVHVDARFHTERLEKAKE